MTCKDCICYEKCKSNRLDFADSAEPTHICQHFKNKADFVEVVRCEKCGYKDVCLQKIDCDYLDREVVYCSYGERKEKNEFKEGTR